MKRPYTCIILGIICLVLAFSSCNSGNKNNKANADNPGKLTDSLHSADPSKVAFGNISPELADSLKSIGQELQEKEIDPTKDNTIRGKKGTALYIPAGSLVDPNGNAISSSVIIELKEHYSLGDYITSNLQTVHNNDILQTQGMIYFSARTKDGSAVQIDQSKPIRIELPVKERIQEAKIFNGQRDAAGNMNWAEITEPSRYLVPYPIHFLSHKTFGECPPFYGITRDTVKKYFTYYGDVGSYENTFLATREFRERYNMACWPEVVSIYINNLDKNLWEADELVVKYFIKDSTERVNFEMSNHPPRIDNKPVTKEQWKAHEWLIKNAKDFGYHNIKAFKAFANQKLTKIDPTKRVADTTTKELNKAFVAYDALKFGWVNVDFFYNDPRSEKIKLLVKTNEAVPIINLIIPGKNVILTGIAKEDKVYNFTKNEDGYNKLPKGEKAIIFCISIVDNKLHFSEKEIIIGKNETETIELEVTTAKIIKAKLKRYGS